MSVSEEKAVIVLKRLDKAGAKTQNTKILAHLFAIGPITPLEALDKYGCLRLSGRIHDLRKMGVPITTKNITRNGKTFAEYRLQEDING